MQENTLTNRQWFLEKIKAFCDVGLYGEAMNLMIEQKIDFKDNVFMRSFLSDLINDLTIIESIDNCCCDKDGCGTIIGGCFGLAFCGLCCITVIDGGDIAKGICGSATNYCEGLTEKVCCS